MSKRRRTKIGRINKERLERLQGLNNYYEVDINVEGASDEIRGSLKVYDLIYAEFPKVFGADAREFRIGMGKYGFDTLEEAKKCKSMIEDAVRSKGFKPIAKIRQVTIIE